MTATAVSAFIHPAKISTKHCSANEPVKYLVHLEWEWELEKTGVGLGWNERTLRLLEADWMADIDM